jgi:hypothetical protein
MRAIVESAETERLPVVFNLSGGTKMMSIGGLTGGRNRPLLINVGGAPLRTEFLMGVEQKEAPRNGELSFDDYLTIYGMREVERAQRQSAEQFFRDHAPSILAFGDLLVPQSSDLVRPLDAPADCSVLIYCSHPEGDIAIDL